MDKKIIIILRIKSLLILIDALNRLIRILVVSCMVDTVNTKLRENLILLQENNKGADQPAHPHSMSIVICVLEKIIAKHATCKIIIIYLVIVAEQAGLSLTPSLNVTVL